MSCCAVAEELEVKKMAEIIMLLKDSNSMTHYDSLTNAALLVMELVENKEQYNKVSQFRIDSLVKDVNKRRKFLDRFARRNRRTHNTV